MTHAIMPLDSNCPALTARLCGERGGGDVRMPVDVRERLDPLVSHDSTGLFMKWAFWGSEIVILDAHTRVTVMNTFAYDLNDRNPAVVSSDPSQQMIAGESTSEKLP